MFIFININLITYYRLSKYKGEHDDDDVDGKAIFKTELMLDKQGIKALASASTNANIHTLAHTHTHFYT